MPNLLDAKNPDGSQRFYPPGEHPATYRLRMHLKALNEMREQVPDTVELLQAILYTEHKLAEFEIGEERAKRQWIEAHSRDFFPPSQDDK